MDTPKKTRNFRKIIEALAKGDISTVLEYSSPEMDEALPDTAFVVNLKDYESDFVLDSRSFCYGPPASRAAGQPKPVTNSIPVEGTQQSRYVLDDDLNLDLLFHTDSEVQALAEKNPGGSTQKSSLKTKGRSTGLYLKRSVAECYEEATRGNILWE
ncbi:uncharacterized protein LOC119689894 [Teleopsis dalmanni]|uniref:uncharacterized protein LOC119689894 n=1 Tax=Teleopsis dalmanni TaxID=139649 RepID=UPI0018CEBD8A|nr:uncharacterized protein LOC119689894 [Teleopsis dalmanni]